MQSVVLYQLTFYFFQIKMRDLRKKKDMLNRSPEGIQLLLMHVALHLTWFGFIIQFLSKHSVDFLFNTAGGQNSSKHHWSDKNVTEKQAYQHHTTAPCPHKTRHVQTHMQGTYWAPASAISVMWQIAHTCCYPQLANETVHSTFSVSSRWTKEATVDSQRDGRRGVM